MARLITSLNWVVGSLAIAASLLFFLLRDTYVSWAARAPGQIFVQTVAKAERDHFTAREQYVPFGPDEPLFGKALETLKVTPPPDHTFRFEAFSRPGSTLVIRATTSPEELRKGRIPPLVYEYTIANPGETGEGKWVPLSK